MMIRGYEIAGRTIAALVLVVVAVLILLWGPAACQKIRSLTAQGRMDKEQSGAFHNSAADAVGTQGEANKRESESEATTRSNERTIRDAEGANDAVNPAVRDAGFASLCKRASFRNSPTGRLRCPAPGGVEKGRRGS